VIGSARRRDLFLTAHNTHKRQTSMNPAGFETAIPASEADQNPPRVAAPIEEESQQAK